MAAGDLDAAVDVQRRRRRNRASARGRGRCGRRRARPRSGLRPARLRARANGCGRRGRRRCAWRLRDVASAAKLRPSAVASAGWRVSPTIPRMSYSRRMVRLKIVGHRYFLLGLSPRRRPGRFLDLAAAGMARPAIISRNSWRAVMCPMPTSPRSREVEQGQALGEQFAVDDALAEAGDDAEADAAGELVERGADAAEVVRIRYAGGGCGAPPSRRSCRSPWRAGCGCSRSVRHRSSGVVILKFSGSTWPIRSRSTKLSFIGVTSVSAWTIAARATGSSRPGVSMTMTSALGRQAVDRGFEAGFGLILEHFEGGAGEAPCRGGASSRRDFRDSGSWSAGDGRGRARRRGGPRRRARSRCGPRWSTCPCRPFHWRRR